MASRKMRRIQKQPPRAGGTGTDPLLNILISLADGEMGLGAGISVIVGGQVITGAIMPRAKFMERYKADFQQGLAKAITEKLKASAEVAEKSAKATDLMFTIPDGGAKFLHLENARVIYPSKSMPEQSREGIMMRIRLDRVDALIPTTITYS